MLSCTLTMIHLAIQFFIFEYKSKSGWVGKYPSAVYFDHWMHAFTWSKTMKGTQKFTFFNVRNRGSHEQDRFTTCFKDLWNRSPYLGGWGWVLLNFINCSMLQQSIGLTWTWKTESSWKNHLHGLLNPRPPTPQSAALPFVLSCHI